MSQVRIVGGEWRRRQLKVIDSLGLRPTPDRVRETLFNWLGQQLDGQRCLDLFAGSGVLGFEAVSRGAASVMLVEQASKVFSQLEMNARLLAGDDPRLQLRRMDALQCLAAVQHQGGRFDMVFLDPPYGQNWLARVLPLLEPLLNERAQVYAEAEKPLADCLPEAGGWEVLRENKAGKVHFGLLSCP